MGNTGDSAKPIPEVGGRIKIVSDGTMVGTTVYTADGTPIGSIQELRLDINVQDAVPKAHLVIYLPKLEVEAEIESVETVSVPYYELGSQGDAVGLVDVPKKK